MKCENCKALERRLREREEEVQALKGKLLRSLAHLENIERAVIAAVKGKYPK